MTRSPTPVQLSGLTVGALFSLWAYILKQTVGTALVVACYGKRQQEARYTHTHMVPQNGHRYMCIRTRSCCPFPPCTHRASSERLLEVIVSEMFGVGSWAKGVAVKREQRGLSKREVEKEEAGARGGCKLIGAKWAADEVVYYVASTFTHPDTHALCLHCSLSVFFSIVLHNYFVFYPLFIFLSCSAPLHNIQCWTMNHTG